ncbi:MAG: hypothetical protein ABSG85_09545 [Spirochaetia bacterium]|jgi:hypothetical protein
MSNTYSAQNAVWREKLISLTKRLSDKDLGRDAGGSGWTVGGLLGHMAFYDLRSVALLERWKKAGIVPSPLDIDIVNDAARPLLNAVAPGEMKRLVVDAAMAVDAAIDALEPDFLSRIETEGKPFRLNRAGHREHHLEQIEKALA